MNTVVDKRTVRGKELAERLNKQTVYENMPKLYYVRNGQGAVRVGRTDYPGDVFYTFPEGEFETFRIIYDQLGMPLFDYTHNNGDEGEEEAIQAEWVKRMTRR